MKSPAPPEVPSFVAKQLAAVASLEKVVVPQAGQAATLTGKAKLISDRGGGIISDNGGGIIANNAGSIISDNGGGIISNNSGAIISDNGGGLISNNGGGLVSNNGGGLTSKTKYAVAQAPAGLAVFTLAEAVITLHDARGRVLVDDAGQPLMATTGADGGYRLEAALPPGNLVAKIRLWNGGELQAMVARDGAGALTLDLDTASTMGAAYVLGQFVKGDQAVFDKLPRAENERLTRELDVVRGYLTTAFTYDARVLTQAADVLRARVPAVDRTLEDVEALLLGQANLGGGRPATQVALSDPIAIHVRKNGEILVAERFVGRVRSIDAQGLLSTLLDGAFGKVKANFPTLSEVIEGPDGALYACAFRLGYVFRIDGTEARPLAGVGQQGRAAVAGPLETPMAPYALAFGPDGTLYIGEARGDGKVEHMPPRLYALAGGKLTQVAGATWDKGNVQALQVGPDGAIYVLFQHNGEGGRVLKIHQGVQTTVATGLGCGDEADMVRGADGTLYVAEDVGGTLTAIAPDGTKRAIEGPAPSADGPALRVPCGLGLGPDGTLYVADQTTSMVLARDPQGAWRVVAGTQAAQQVGDVTSFAISLPGGVTEDADGNVMVAEGGSHTVKRFRGGRLEIVAGGLRGYAGDGGPAGQARLYSPTGITMHDGALWILDTGNRAIRVVGADGTIATRVGGKVARTDLAVGERGTPLEMDVGGAIDIAFAPDGNPYWTSQARGQVWRLAKDAAGQEVVEGVLGKTGQGVNASLDFAAVMGQPFDPDPAKLALHFPMGLTFDAAGAMYVADAVACQILKVTGPATAGARAEVHAGIPIAEIFGLAAELGPDAPVASEEGLEARKSAVVVPTGLCFDGAGNLYVAEAGTMNLKALSALFGGRFPVDPAFFPKVPARIRRIGADGRMTTVAGPGGKFFKDPAAEDALALPTAIRIDEAGRLVIIDSGANLIRILPAGSY